MGDSKKALADANSFLEAVVENIPNMIFVKDAKELRFVRFNKAGEELLGWPRTALIGKNDYDFFPREEADFFTTKDRQVLEGSGVLDIPEEVIQTAHGRRWLHTRKVPVVDAEGQPMFLLGISEDITEKRHSREELTRLNQELERSNRELQQFAYVASHDLQEPLRTISSYLQLIQRRYRGRLDAEADEFIDFAVEGAHRLQALIEGLLAFSRAGTRDLERAPVDLGRVLTHVRRDLQVALDRAGAILTVGDLPTVNADATQMTQLFQNLVGNALKFRGEASPVISVQAVREGEAWVITVRDNGIGIAPEFHERIFGIFQRLHSMNQYPGSGIGLAICRRIVERHGGAVRVESTAGQGSAFIVTLPD
jgi:PAS domain S-box-containing protein